MVSLFAEIGIFICLQTSLLVVCCMWQANMILESFKACFTHGLSLSPPLALCEFCPLLKLHDLCRSLEGKPPPSRSPLDRCLHTVAGVSSQVAQSRIHDVLATFKDSHYKNIMRQLKVSMTTLLLCIIYCNPCTPPPPPLPPGQPACRPGVH